MSKKTKKSLIKNAAILFFAGLFCRLLGALYRIPLYSLIDEDGIGLYAIGYDIYALLLVISAAGIPIAISKLVAEEISKNRMGEAKRIFKIATILITAIGFVMTLGLIITAPLIAKFVGDSRALYTLMAIAPSIFLVSVMASFRGFFQGLQIMWPTAISQILEQTLRIVTVLCLVTYIISIGSKLEITVAAASFGSTVGSLIGLLTMLLIFFKSKPYINSLINKFPDTSKRTTTSNNKKSTCICNTYYYRSHGGSFNELS